MTPTPTTPKTGLRVRIFVDFWNFSLELRRGDNDFKVTWDPLGPLLTTEAGKLVNPALPATFEALHVYGSYDPNKPNDNKLKNWMTNVLDKKPGTHVVLQARQRKLTYPKCPDCHTEVTHCQSCGHDLRGTEEKGVDTRIATDLISLAWADAYDIAVLVSADRDFVPVVEFLQTKGIKVVHGAFPPKGSHLSQKCWGNLNLHSLAPQFRAAAKPAGAAPKAAS